MSKRHEAGTLVVLGRQLAAHLRGDGMPNGAALVDLLAARVAALTDLVGKSTPEDDHELWMEAATAARATSGTTPIHYETLYTLAEQRTRLRELTHG